MAKLLPQRKGRKHLCVFVMKCFVSFWTIFVYSLSLETEVAHFFPKCLVAESARGSDLMLEAVLEAEVAHKAKSFFAQAEKETPALKGEAKQSL